MKKFFISVFAIVAVLALLFTYILYTEGVFESAPKASEVKPFAATMKCEAGKCATGKCAGGK